jgi:hypothetical protein
VRFSPVLVFSLLGLTACEATIGSSGQNPPEVDPVIAIASGARRLSQAELDNTLRDLFGDDSAPASRLLNEDEFAPFDNDYGLQQASEALINSVEALAEGVASRFVGDGARRSQLMPCQPASATDASCFRAFLEGFLPRAFRRELSAEEIEPYMGLLGFASEDVPGLDNDFYTAVELAISAMIQDPDFLYRVERGTHLGDGVWELDDFEIASRMSYLLWATMPDDALFEAARAGELRDPAGRRAHAERMLGDQRARDQLHRFHAMWLGYRAIPVSAQLASAFNRETSALIDRVILDEPGDYVRLFTMDETFVDDALASHYGLPSPGDAEGWVSYEGTGRAGILGHGSLLAAFSKFADTSPTQRGIMVRTRLMCQAVPPPPPNVDADQPPQGAQDAVCKYDRYAQHRDQSSSCAGCHSMTDPIGFGLENYDIEGRFRETDDGLPQCFIEGEGEITEYGTFSGPAELSELLVDNELVDACAVQQFVQFAIGRRTTPLEGELVAEIIDSFRSDQGRDFKRFLLDFVSDDRFSRRAQERL